MEERACKNCGKPVADKYCGHCGQKVITNRLTLIDSLSMLFSSVFSLERGFFFTTWELLKNPEEVTRAYINGITVRFFHPFRFIFVWASVSALLNVYFHSTDAVGEYFKMNENAPDLSWINQYMSLILMGTIPFMSLFSRLLYRKKDLNYTEHLVVNAYANGLSTAVGILGFGLYLFPNLIEIAISLSFLIMIGVTGYVYSRTFTENIILSMFKFILVYILVIISSSVLSGIVVLIYVVISKLLGIA